MLQHIRKVFKKILQIRKIYSTQSYVNLQYLYLGDHNLATTLSNKSDDKRNSITLIFLLGFESIVV